MTYQIGKPLAQALLGLVLGIGLVGVGAQQPAPPKAVNAGAAVTQDFQKRIANYMELRRNAEDTLTHLKKPTTSPARIQHYQHELREAIVRRRPHAVQGNIFTPEISAEFRRLIALAYQAGAKNIQASLLHAEPGTKRLRVRVNRGYPSNRPLQSMPSSLLINLPPLPSELEYRAVGADLVLRDVGANLIVDIVTGVIPK